MIFGEDEVSEPEGGELSVFVETDLSLAEHDRVLDIFDAVDESCLVADGGKKSE